MRPQRKLFASRSPPLTSTFLYLLCRRSGFFSSDCLALLQGHTSLVGQLQLTNDLLVTGGSDGRVIIFSLSTFECLHRLCAHDNSVTCLQFDDRFIVSGGEK